jgi:hypothetical protein
LAERIFQDGGHVDQVAGAGEQVLAVVGQTPVAGRAVEQTDLEMLFKLSNQAVTAELLMLFSRATPENVPVSKCARLENVPVSTMRTNVPRARSISMTASHDTDEASSNQIMSGKTGKQRQYLRITGNAIE